MPFTELEMTMPLETSTRCLPVKWQDMGTFWDQTTVKELILFRFVRNTWRRHNQQHPLDIRIYKDQPVGIFGRHLMVSLIQALSTGRFRLSLIVGILLPQTVSTSSWILVSQVG